MLDELSKEDKRWRKIALYICKDKSLADDITNDMYIRLYDTGKKYSDINSTYVYLTIKSLYLNHVRNNGKTFTFTEIFDECEREIKELFNCEDLLQERQLINNALKELSFFDREILLHTSERSLRDNEEYLGIKYQTLHFMKNRAMEKLKETKTIKENGLSKTG